MKKLRRSLIPQRRRIFVGCEGQSERGYIARIKDIVEGIHRTVHLDGQLLQPGGGDHLALIQRAQTIIAREERIREPYVKKYIFLDADKLGADLQKDQQAVALAAALGATLIWQRPTHEAVLLRHLPNCDMRRPGSTTIALQQLANEWPNYAKPMTSMQLAEKIDFASVERVAKVERELAAFFIDIGLLPDPKEDVK